MWSGISSPSNMHYVTAVNMQCPPFDLACEVCAGPSILSLDNSVSVH